MIAALACAGFIVICAGFLLKSDEAVFVGAVVQFIAAAFGLAP